MSAHENAVQSLINGGYGERQAREILSLVRGEAQEEGYNRGAAAARAKAIADRDAQIIAWLVKKAGEEGSSNKESRTRADAIFRLADKLSRGAVRPPLSKGPEPLLTETERQFLTFALDLAFDAMVSGDGFTDEDDAALAKFRRMADEAASGGAS